MEVWGRETQQASAQRARQNSRSLDGVRRQNQETGARAFIFLRIGYQGPMSWLMCFLARSISSCWKLGMKKIKANLKLHKVWQNSWVCKIQLLKEVKHYFSICFCNWRQRCTSERESVWCLRRDWILSAILLCHRFHGDSGAQRTVLNLLVFSLSPHHK